MALRILLFLPLSGVLCRDENKLPSVEDCCNRGRAIALREHDCAAQQAFTSAMCSIVLEQCCRSSAAAMSCNDGIKMAREQGACERPFFRGFDWQTLMSKVCCDCCTLGLMVENNGWTCDFQGLELGERCLAAAKACCLRPREVKPTVKAAEPKVFTTAPPQTPKSCEEANCSQLCLENGMCACREGFHMKMDGVTCQDIDECLTGRHNCVAGQGCLNTEGSFQCKENCGGGYILRNDLICEDADECAFGTHTCGADSVCINTVGSFRCEPKKRCGAGFVRSAGGVCVDINECVVQTNPCQPDQTCVNTEGSYTCRSDAPACARGYRPSADGSHCEDIDECLTNDHDCRPGEVCFNIDGSYHCQANCAPGFALSNDNKCKDVDECLTANVCGDHGSCVNLKGSYRCECQAGFTVGSVSRKCEDMDECSLWGDACGANLLCINTVGSFRCDSKTECGDGYVQDPTGNCIDINECVAHSHPCRPGQTCINTVGSFYCRSIALSCARGFHLTADGTHCEDVDECLLHDVCGGHGSCLNLEGSYRCECKTGFMFNSVSKQCEDINECLQYSGRLCSHSCENTEGSYRCSCLKGFKLAPDGKNCDDVDECEAEHCSQECANVYGSFQCYCRRGFELNDIDGVTCQDIDECSIPNVCSYRCVNTIGGFNCTCPSGGYTLGHDGRSCEDIDECAAGTHSCSASESCFNIQGGFRCLFFDCPPNFQRATSGENSLLVRCVKSCKRHNADCIKNPVQVITSTVLSLPTLRHFDEPEDIAVIRTAAAAKPAPLPGDPQVYFDIQATDEQQSFDVVKRSQHGLVTGVIRQVKPVMGPRELVLEVTMNYVQSGVISQQNVVIIHVFVYEL